MERLIECVRSRPLLYDKTSKDYRNRDKIESAWKEIATNCDLTEHECLSKWRNLRGQYNREQAKAPTSGSSGRKQSKWVYTDQMSFLRPHLVKRKSESNIDQSEFDELTSLLDSDSETKENFPDDSITKVNGRQSKKKRSFDDEVLTVLKEKPDDIEAFGQYITAELRTLTKVQQDLFKLRCQELIYKIKHGENVEAMNNQSFVSHSNDLLNDYHITHLS